MSDSNEPKPWTIRGVSMEVRQTATEAADRADMALGPWVSHAIRQTAASDKGGLAGEVVAHRKHSTSPTIQPDRASDMSQEAVVSMLFTGLALIADKPNCGGVARRTRALLDQRLAALATEPLPPRQQPPMKRLTSE